MSDLLNLNDILGGTEHVEALPPDTGAQNAQGNAAPCRLGVFGSRSLKDTRVMDIISRVVATRNAGLIVTAAEPEGVCTVAQEWCRKHHFPLQVHFLQQDKYARGKWEHRSDHVIANSDLVLLIHDGVSRGTHNEMLRTLHFHVPYVYERIPQMKGIGAA